LLHTKSVPPKVSSFWGAYQCVVGILNTKNYFRLKNKTKEWIVAMVKPAYFVPETIRANIIFQNMKKTGNTMAIVLDEHGGMTGLITLNDLIEKTCGQLN